MVSGKMFLIYHHVMYMNKTKRCLATNDVNVVPERSYSICCHTSLKIFLCVFAHIVMCLGRLCELKRLDVSWHILRRCWVEPGRVETRTVQMFRL